MNSAPKFVGGKLQVEKDVVMEKYSSEGLLGLDAVALARQLCIIDLGMLKEIRCVVTQFMQGQNAIAIASSHHSFPLLSGCKNSCAPTGSKKTR